MKFSSLFKFWGKRGQRRQAGQPKRAGGWRARLQVESLEARQLLANNTPFIQTITPPDGTATGNAHPAVVITFSDLSEHRFLERQLEQARRISGLGRIAATTAHEFNNVLMGIQPFADILERTIEDPRVRKIARHLTQSVQRGKSITHEILRFANDAALDLKPMNISPWLEAFRSRPWREFSSCRARA